MNCKPGDLAIITSSIRTQEIVGRIVEIVSVAVKGEVFELTCGGLISLHPSFDGPMWRVRSNRPLEWRMTDGEVREAYEVPIFDSYLRPISGVPVNDEVTDDIKEPA